MKAQKPNATAPIESELKYALTADEYRKLLSHLKALKSKPVAQINHYFDTPELLLRQKRIGLRIRISGGSHAELTLKFPKPQLKSHPAAFKSRYEFESTIPLPLARKALRGKFAITDFEVEATSVLKEKIPPPALKQIAYLGAMKNQRIKVRHRGFEFELDRFSYFGKTLYELEIETEDPQAADRVYRALCQQLEIAYHPSLTSKLSRFLDAWKAGR